MAVDGVVFTRYARWFWIAPLALFAASGSVLLLSRVASPSLADLLLDWMPFGWWGTEASLLLLTSVATASYFHYGWSGRLFRRYSAGQQEIFRLHANIARRGRPGSSAVAKIAVFALGVVLLRPAHAQVLIEDCTGSVADSHAIEQTITDGAAKVAGYSLGLDLIRVADHPFSAQPIHVRWQTETHEVLGTSATSDAWNRRMGERAREALDQAFRAEVKPATCTSVKDMLALASESPKPVLLVSDFVHTCIPVKPPARPEDRLDGKGILLVVVLSKSDSGNDSEVFGRRQQFIERYMQGATILKEFKLGNAVQTLLKAHGNAQEVIRQVSSRP